MTFNCAIFEPEFTGRFMLMYQKADFQFKQKNESPTNIDRTNREYFVSQNKSLVHRQNHAGLF